VSPQKVLMDQYVKIWGFRSSGVCAVSMGE